MAQFDSRRYHRRSIRLKGYDYAQAGAYFVTLCTHNRQDLFGEIVEGVMRLNGLGHIVAEEWLRSPQVRQEVELDEWVVMPDHFHGIVVIVGANDGVETVGATGWLEDEGTGRLEDEGTGRLEDEGTGRLEDEGTGRLEDEVTGRLEDEVTGRLAVGATGRLPQHGPAPRSLGAFIAGFKSSATKRINILRNMPGVPVWQRNYYEHIIRNERELRAIRQYIQNNPLKWALDRDNPSNWSGRPAD